MRALAEYGAAAAAAGTVGCQLPGVPFIEAMHCNDSRLHAAACMPERCDELLARCCCWLNINTNHK